MNWTPEALFAENRNLLFYAVIACSFIISRVPFVGKFVKVINTLVHETGHAAMALISNGQVVSVDLNPDASGLAKTKSKSKIQAMIIAMAGYPCASFTGFILFYFILKQDFGWVLYLLLSFSLVNLMFWVRNAFGIFWILFFSALLIFIYLKAPVAVVYSTSVFCASTLVIESLVSSFLIFFYSFKDHKQAGDAKTLKELTSIPAFLWGLFFVCQSVYFVYLTLSLFLPLLNA
jgi:hypothetical protein